MTRKTKGSSLLLLLHAHLPYVRHPEHEHFLEENWLYEAAVETYIPLLDVFDRLINDGVDFRLTISLSPTLLEMLGDGLLKERLLRYIEGRLELAGREALRRKKDAAFGPVSRFYRERFKKIKRLYEDKFKKNLIGAFGDLLGTNRFELLTTAATHAYLPNLAPYPEAVRTQVSVGREAFRRHFGKYSIGAEAPAGLWLPECGYFSGLDGVLSKEGVGYFFLEGHGMLGGRPAPQYGVFRPARCPSGAAAFGRDAETARQVWCSKTGYPGDPNYREFYRDIGYEIPTEQHPDGIRIDTGIKYHRITGKGEKKEPYVREIALRTAKEHALDFIGRLSERAAELNACGIRPLFAAPYDAELFGHWWFEGPEWLDAVLRGNKAIRTVAPSEYLGENPSLQRLAPAFSSWGNGGYSDTWLNRKNDGAAVAIHRACRKMREIRKEIEKEREFEGTFLKKGSFKRPPKTFGLRERAVNQMLRELLLLQASDWTFLMNSGSQYAGRRVRGHIEAIDKLHAMLKKGVDGKYLKRLEKRNNIFPWLDYRHQSGKGPDSDE